MLLKSNNGAGWRKVDSSLKMLIKSIYYWLVASQYCKKLVDDGDPSGKSKQGTVELDIVSSKLIHLLMRQPDPPAFKPV